MYARDSGACVGDVGVCGGGVGEFAARRGGGVRICRYVNGLHRVYYDIKAGDTTGCADVPTDGSTGIKSCIAIPCVYPLYSKACGE